MLYLLLTRTDYTVLNDTRHTLCDYVFWIDYDDFLTSLHHMRTVIAICLCFFILQSFASWLLRSCTSTFRLFFLFELFAIIFYYNTQWRSSGSFRAPSPTVYGLIQRVCVFFLSTSNRWRSITFSYWSLVVRRSSTIIVNTWDLCKHHYSVDRRPEVTLKSNKRIISEHNLRTHAYRYIFCDDVGTAEQLSIRRKFPTRFSGVASIEIQSVHGNHFTIIHRVHSRCTWHVLRIRWKTITLKRQY